MSEPHRQEPPMEEPELSASESASLEATFDLLKGAAASSRHYRTSMRNTSSLA
jgi:hypothetical protein